jgi:translation initiation factor 2B subunit (eIF-2B alpha/beta/delta family)
VGPAMQDEIARKLAELRADHEHGASAIAQGAARLLARICAAGTAGELPPDAARDLLRATCREVAAARPSMAPLAHVASRVWRATQEGNAATGLAAAQREIDAILAEARTAPDRIAAHLGARLTPAARVVTLSRSATVTHALLANADRISAITCLESRPGGEGATAAREMAAGLAARGWAGTMRLVADAALALAVAEADGAVVGADALLADGFAVNKVGTHPLALAAHAAGIPCYVVAERMKIAPAGWRWQPERFDPALIAPDPIPGVAVEAVVFERTPLTLVTLLGQDDIMDAREVAQQAASLAAQL